MRSNDFTGKEYPPLSDVLERHLRECQRCQASLAAPPVPNVRQPHMTRTRLCGEWFDLIQNYAIREGAVNNIVAETESGALAYKQERLWGYEGDDDYDGPPIDHGTYHDK
jgi:hypothetical protein